MKDRSERSLISMARAEGFCIACVSIDLRVLLIMNDIVINDSDEEKKFFALYQNYVPTMTWEMFQNGIHDPRNVFSVIQEAVPNLTKEMYQELAETRDQEKIEDFINNHLDVLKGSLLWEMAEDSYDEYEVQENREYHIQETMDYLTDADENQEAKDDDGKETDREEFVPVLLWHGGTCREEKGWYGEPVAVRIKLAKEYLGLPSLTAEEVRKTLQETEPEKEMTIRSGNAVIVGSQDDGYNHFYIGLANPKRPWMIKYDRRSRREFVGYIETDKYGYVTDECLR